MTVRTTLLQAVLALARRWSVHVVIVRGASPEAAVMSSLNTKAGPDPGIGTALSPGI